MKYLTALILLFSFLEGVAHYGNNYLPAGVSVAFKSKNTNQSAKIQLANGQTRGRVAGGANDIPRGQNTSKQVLSATATAPVYTNKALVEDWQEPIAEKIQTVFGDASQMAIAVFRAESGLRPEAQGWNCFYKNAQGQTYSAACEAQDRQRAWSVDCGVAQLNFAGTACPQEAFNPDWNIAKAKEKYNNRGWQPWNAYTNGHYLAFLKK